MIARDFFLSKFFLICFKFCALASILMLFSCERKQRSYKNLAEVSKTETAQTSFIGHAVGFDLVPYDKYSILHLFRHYNDAKDTLSFVLKKDGAVVDSGFKKLKQIQVPLYHIALLHSSYLSFFDLLETSDHLGAISEGKYIFNQKMFNAVVNGVLPEVGYGELLDKEKLLALGISAVITVGWPNAPNKSQQLLGELGIPVLIFSDWQETTLLGRLEWLKVIAALTGKEDAADSIFSEIASRYNTLQLLTAAIDKKPDIICNLPYKGSWYMPGGDSYISNVLQDAGANYLWSDQQGTGGIQIDFEAVYAKGISADYWINPGFAGVIVDIVENDERLKDFRAVISGHVYNNNKRVSREIANDYWESGIVKPDVVLADLIRIFHPELLPDHELYYYQNIK